MHRRHRPFLAVMSRQRNVLLAMCLIGLITLWSCRLPRLCIFDQCNADITAGPLAHSPHDLSNPEAPFIGWPLARVCNETEWVDGLVFICDNNSGGIGNIRGYILTCIRYAIEAGATGLVMPQIRTRSDEDLADIMQEHRDFDYFFDADHFRTSLTASCPRMVIYNNTWSIPGFKEPYRAEMITPRTEFGSRGGCDKRDLNRHTDLFSERFRQRVLVDKAEEFNLPPVSVAHPRVIRMNWGVQLEWPVYRDGPEFAATFGGLLRFRGDILQLGKRAIEAMREIARSTDPGSAEGRYAGFHLRTESDALKGWPSFRAQSNAYLWKAAARGLKVAYLATGNATEARKFTELAAQLNIVAKTKHDLLSSMDELRILESLSWDQQALIDFIVLVASDFFFGVNPSSFSINVALKRHLHVDGLYTRPWKIGRDDGRSLIVGRFERYWDDWLFMYDSIWP